jgi:hypothetical protein
MRDNFKLIRPLLKFESADDFYFLQILQRKKDGPGPNGIKITGTNNKSRAIKSYCIGSLDYFDKIEDEVKHLCTYFNARAMIILAKKSYQKTALLHSCQVANHIMSNQFENIKNCYWSSCAKSPSDDKYFLIDIDAEDMDSLDMIKDTIENKVRNDKVPFGQRIKAEIPSRSGMHLITHPFDTRILLKEYAKDKHEFVHTNGPTILYAP